MLFNQYNATICYSRNKFTSCVYWNNILFDSCLDDNITNLLFKFDANKKAITVIKNLTKTDFPEMDKVIHISDDGWINYCTFTKN